MTRRQLAGLTLGLIIMALAGVVKACRVMAELSQAYPPPGQWDTGEESS